MFVADRGVRQIARGPGTKNSHWRESIFKTELISGFIAAQNNPLSKVTAAGLKDLGYVVSMNAAEAYTLPNLLQMAERGMLAADAETVHAHTLPVIPMTLPNDSLDVQPGA
jgi:hypothetical protein